MTARIPSTRTHCPNGHRWTKATIYVNPKTRLRQCRLCKTESMRRSREHWARQMRPWPPLDPQAFA